MQIAIDRIHPASEPIRKSWDEDKLTELAQSIAEQGLIVPIKVRPNGDGYEVVYGHRRLEAMRRNGAAEIEAIIEGMEDTNALIQALIENLQQEDMQPIDKARAIQVLQNKTGWALREIQRRGIINHSISSPLLSLLSEPEDVQKMVANSTEGGVLQGGGRFAPDGKVSLRTYRLTSGVGLQESEFKQVLEKAAREQLGSNLALRIAESVAAAPSEQAKKMLLEHEYSPVIHDPEHIKARAAIHGAHDPFYQSNGDKIEQKTWDSTPEVKMAIDGVIEAAKTWTMLIAEIRKMVQVGKIAPEGRSFTALKLRSLAQTLNRFADELEQE